MTDLIKQPKVQEAINLYATEPTITAQEVADKLGVSTALVYKWRQNPNFIEAYYDKYMVEFGGELPAVLQSMIREAKAGNVQAARLVLEHSGKLVKNINQFNKEKYPITIPLFDKLTDDKSKSIKMKTKFDILFLEGWCCGSSEIPKKIL